MKRKDILIVTPALADANNGNWQTARRWARFLGRDYRVQITDAWAAGPAGADAELMIALHARRSAASVAAWHAAHPQRPLVLVLTGPDLYRDIDTDPAARQSLRLAQRLVVLNERGAQRLPLELRDRVTVCLQSASARRPRAKTARHLRALMVGHLRDEKRPQTFFEAARALQHRNDILFDHIGGSLDPVLAAQARALASQQPRYRWLGALPHDATRRRIAAAHLLVHPSQIEGGAHVVTEAVVSGTPVLASRIDGNVGLLGADYGGYFEPGDAAGLATLLKRMRDDPSMLVDLRRQCAERAPLFDPVRERRTVLSLVAQLLSPHPKMEKNDERP
ncbi:MAG TPA: selenoneine biosynthesis selenosugar synthase SenB [Rubrivivax sp.]|nr:selenoneine biosynthesis selenosugar synthase SenB [Rubrivivax sp.]